MKPARLPFSLLQRDIFIYGLAACIQYIVVMVVMQIFGLLEIIELRMINYVLLCLTTIYQVKKRISETGRYIPFLKVFILTLLTGAMSFALFSIYIYVYSFFDTPFYEMLLKHTPGEIRSIPALIILFEGIGVSVIIGFINLQYFLRYEEQEAEIKK
jgi:hypothetical protein